MLREQVRRPPLNRRRRRSFSRRMRPASAVNQSHTQAHNAAGFNPPNPVKITFDIQGDHFPNSTPHSTSGQVSVCGG